MNSFNEKISQIGVVPVIKLNNPEKDAEPLAAALCAGGVPVAETNDKVAYIDPHLFPACSFLDPTYTFTVNAKHTAAGVADAINHVMEQYFTHASNIPVPAGQSSQSLEGLGRWDC